MGNQEKKYDYLEKVFENINYWLAFAEAKNATNLAFVAAVMAIVNEINMCSLRKGICVFLIVLSGICSFISLIPNVSTKIGYVFNKGNRPLEVNLLLFEHIRFFTGREYLKKFYKKYYNQTPASFPKNELDLSDEIVYNATLASNKYYLFKCAVILDFAIVIIAGIGIVFR